jgi:hypothetical protein
MDLKQAFAGRASLRSAAEMLVILRGVTGSCTYLPFAPT